MEFSVHCYDGVRSGMQSAQIKLDSETEQVIVTFEDGEIRQIALAELKISPRLGNTMRRIEFPGGGACETSDNDAVDVLERRRLGKRRSSQMQRWVHKLESKFRYAVLAVAILVVVVWGSISVGIPVLAKHVAFSVPVNTSSLFGDDVLEVMDQITFSESELSERQQSEIAAQFFHMTETMPSEYSFQLVFRKGGEVGANAMALPSGTVVVTDELVKLVRHDDELTSILAHEIGHVVHRHILRQMVQSSAVGLLVVGLTGDLSTVSLMAASLPTMMTEMHYSREFEREADQFAYDYMVKNRINPIHFANVMERLMEAHDVKEEGNSGFFSTHPATQERVKLFQDGN